jgi:hypothetical protein
LLVDGRSQIRILEAQKLMDPDPEHCFSETLLKTVFMLERSDSEPKKSDKFRTRPYSIPNL